MFFPSVFSVSPGSLSLYGDCGVLVFPGSVLSIGVPLLLGEMSFLPKALGMKKAKICRGRSLRITVILSQHIPWNLPAQEEEGASFLSKGLSLLTELALGSGTQHCIWVPRSSPTFLRQNQTKELIGNTALYPNLASPQPVYGASAWSTTKKGMLLTASTAWEWLVGVRVA